MSKLWWTTPLVLVAVAAGLSGASRLSVARAQGGPTVKVTAPTNGAALSNPVTVTVTTSGATIKAATENDANAAHLHYFVDRDPAAVLQPGQPIPSGQADIIHTPDVSQALPTLSPGPHRVWVVLAHTDHTPYSPNVQDLVSFTIGAAAAAPAAAPQAAAPQIPPTGTGGLLPSARTNGAGILGQVWARGEGLSIVLGAGLATACLLVAAGVMLSLSRRNQ
jgi:hypothetical protein